MKEPQNIYVASSWRNLLQPAIVSLLRRLGHTVYDFRNPGLTRQGFRWNDIDPNWQDWTLKEYVDALSSPFAELGFENDASGMKKADCCVLVLPCGRSAHLEAGWFVGKSRPLYILAVDKTEPELMYKMATKILCSLDELFDVFEIRNLEDELSKSASSF